MKKIIGILIVLLATLFLFACQPSSNPTDEFLAPPTITGAQDILYYIGDPLPNYRENVFAYDYLDSDITEDLEVDDRLVDLTQEGTYQLYYKITDRFNQIFQTYVHVVVMPEWVEETVDYAPIIYGTKDITYNIGATPPQLFNQCWCS